jgi:hypothetical protein
VVTLTVRRRDVAWALAMVVMLSAVWVARGDLARAGGTPPGEGISVVYIAVGTGFPDSLGVGPGGGVNGAPIIIVPTNPPIPQATASELVRLDPRSVVIVGGTAVVSTSMQSAIGSLLPNAAISRLAGANRYETNAMFSQAVFPVESWAAIPPSAFSGLTPATDTVQLGVSFAYNASNGILVAPIQLPHGAQILELKVSGNDTDATFNLIASLNRQPHQSITAETIIGVTSTGTPGYFAVSTQSIPAGLAIVDNERYSYAVLVTGADGNPWLENTMVRYRLGSP